MCGLLGYGSFFDVIGYPALFAEINDFFCTLIVELLVLRVGGDNFVIM